MREVSFVHKRGRRGRVTRQRGVYGRGRKKEKRQQRRGEKRAERVYLPERVIARRRAVDQGPGGARTIGRRVNTNARIKIG